MRGDKVAKLQSDRVEGERVPLLEEKAREVAALAGDQIRMVDEDFYAIGCAGAREVAERIAEGRS
jgi:hypothetical protein